MRRSIAIAVLAGALVGLAVAAAISIAGSGSSGSSSSQQSSAGSGQASSASAYAKRGRGGGRWGHGHGPMGFGPLALAFTGLADKLEVEKDDLHKALKGVKNRALDRAVADGTISSAERAALEACIKTRGGKGCDRRKARAAHRKLHRALKQRIRSDAAGLKTQLIGDLAAELGKTPQEVDTALRAQLVEVLDMAVKFGFLSEGGRTLVLGCWDDPNNCDRAALRAEIRKRFGHRHGGPGRGGHRWP